MTIFPIITRELRVRSRKKGTYWSRFAIALAGVLVGFPPLTSPWMTGAPGVIGQRLLTGVVGVGFLVSCAACLLTADVISSERREGTLGLLLLTRVSAFDVLLGKLGAAGLASLCALVAFLPVLMIPVLVGGVTGGEVIRKALVLPNTLFVALAAGLWASTRGREWSRTALTAVLLLAALLIGPGILEYLTKLAWKPSLLFGLLSPLGTLLSADNASYAVAPGQYWLSLILVHSMGWLLLLGAAIRVRNGWRQERGEQTMDRETSPARRKAWDTSSGRTASRSGAPASGAAREGPIEGAGPEAGAPELLAVRASLSDHANPIAWLLERQRGVLAIFWAVALLSLARVMFYWVFPAFLGSNAFNRLEFSVSVSAEILIGSLLAWAASRYFIDARHTGELELLLTTPIGTAQLVSTQWKLFRRWLRWPILIMLAPLVFAFITTTLSRSAFAGAPPYYYLFYAISLLIYGAGIVLQAAALCWVGMWFGLTAGSQARAVVGTITLALAVPYLIENLPRVSYFVWPFLWFASSWTMYLLLHAAKLLYYVALIRFARSRLGRLTSGFGPFEPRQPVLSLARGCISAWRKARHWTPSSP